MTPLVAIPKAIRTTPGHAFCPYRFRMAGRSMTPIQVASSRVVDVSLLVDCGPSCDREVASFSEPPERRERVRSYGFSAFDTRLYSGTGSGHVRRPAALGLLLPYAPFTGSGSSPNKSAQTAQNAERISFGPLRKSRPSALGSRAHSRGFAMCAPSKSGAQNGEQTCI